MCARVSTNTRGRSKSVWWIHHSSCSAPTASYATTHFNMDHSTNQPPHRGILTPTNQSVYNYYVASCGTCALVMCDTWLLWVLLDNSLVHLSIQLTYRGYHARYGCGEGYGAVLINTTCSFLQCSSRVASHVHLMLQELGVAIRDAESSWGHPYSSVVTCWLISKRLLLYISSMMLLNFHTYLYIRA